MWEKFKNSKFATKMRNSKSSRAIYVTAITLLLALSVLITATAIANRVKKNNADKDQQNNEQNDNPSDDGSQGNTPVTPDADEPSQDGNSGNTNKPPLSDDKNTGNNDSTPDASTDTVSLPELSLPVNGTISKHHDTTVQVFSATTGDYRIHLGVDMVTREDAPVLAAADGVVSRIWDDALMGKCLALSHSGDCYTIYKNLNPTLADDITVGASVTVGQQLGTVGESAMLELAEEPHLHMEMTVKGLAVDPLEYFSQQALAALGTDNSHEVGAEGSTPEAE